MYHIHIHHMHIYMYTYTCMYLCTLYTYIYVFMYAKHIWICIYRYTHIYIYTHICIYICVCIYIHIHLHIYSHICIYIQPHQVVWLEFLWSFPMYCSTHTYNLTLFHISASFSSFDILQNNTRCKWNSLANWSDYNYSHLSLCIAAHTHIIALFLYCITIYIA